MKLRFFLILLLLVVLFPASVVKAEDTGCKGMTWRVKKRIGEFIRVGNDQQTNPYQGDTPCHQELPILAIKVMDLSRPQLEGVVFGFYQGWCGGYLDITPPVKGSRLTSLAEANRIIREYLGPGWRMAEHHDGGGGWSIWGYGNIPDGIRFWAHINDQRGNCWNSCPKTPKLLLSPKPPPIKKVPVQTKPVAINLARLESTIVSGSSVNGNRRLNNTYYGVQNLFDGGKNIVNGINYTTWLTDRDARHWVKIEFAAPVTIHKIMVECTIRESTAHSFILSEKDTSRASQLNPHQPQELALDITMDSNGVSRVEKLASAPINGFRFFYPLKKYFKDVVEVSVIFPGWSIIEVSEIEVIGVLQSGEKMKIGTPEVRTDKPKGDD